MSKHTKNTLVIEDPMLSSGLHGHRARAHTHTYIKIFIQNKNTYF